MVYLKGCYTDLSVTYNDIETGYMQDAFLKKQEKIPQLMAYHVATLRNMSVSFCAHTGSSLAALTQHIPLIRIEFGLLYIPFQGYKLHCNFTKIFITNKIGIDQNDRRPTDAMLRCRL